jgi:hypothetical protein
MWYYLALFLSKDELSYAYAVILSAAVLSQVRACSCFTFDLKHAEQLCMTCLAAAQWGKLCRSLAARLQLPSC